MTTLFAIPPAGGTASSFQPLVRLADSRWDIHPLELPGRASRGRERPAGTIEEAAADVASAVAASVADGTRSPGWSLYGHSMGGLIAFEAARILQAREIPGGRQLLISGCPAPQQGFGANWSATTTDAEVHEFLRTVGGLPDEIAADADALTYFSALVRADEALLARYVFAAGAPLDLPVTVLTNPADPLTRQLDPRGWELAAGRAVRLRAVGPGGHSSVLSDPAELIAVIASTLAGEVVMNSGAQLYLELMKKVLANVIYEDPPLPSSWLPGADYDRINRQAGLDWPSVAHTMIGLRRLDNVQDCVEQIIAEGIPGDFIETGVWRGGTCIFLRALLQAYGVEDRAVWCADSFAGMPDASAGHPGDADLATHAFNDVLAVSLDTVKRNFERYGLLDEQVRFLPGWFRDTLPAAPIRQLALLRLDGDLYESTTDALVHLYPKLSPGGFIIIDDYLIGVCKQAVHDYREQHGIRDEIQDIDGYGAFWRRGA